MRPTHESGRHLGRQPIGNKVANANVAVFPQIHVHVGVVRCRIESSNEAEVAISENPLYNALLPLFYLFRARGGPQGSRRAATPPRPRRAARKGGHTTYRALHGVGHLLYTGLEIEDLAFATVAGTLRVWGPIDIETTIR